MVPLTAVGHNGASSTGGDCVFAASVDAWSARCDRALSKSRYDPESQLRKPLMLLSLNESQIELPHLEGIHELRYL